MKWYFRALKKYSDFGGRACRQEYWTVIFINCLVLFGVSFTFLAISHENTDNPPELLVYFLCFYVLFMFTPTLAVTIRRLHDTNRMGEYILVSFIPFIGGFTLFVLMCLRGTEGDNNYGVAPQKEYKASPPPPGFL